MAKSKTGMYVGIAAVVIVIIVVAGVLIANNNKGGDDGGSGDSGTSQTSGLTATDLAKIDEEVEYGEFEEMQTLSKAIQNGEMIDKVVKIDGLVSRPGTIYSIVQKNESGSQKIGTKFVIEGMNEEDYPKDGTRVVITGKVVEETPMVYIIKTIPSMVETE